MDNNYIGTGGLYRVTYAESRSNSAENFTGEKGKGGMAVRGTKEWQARHLGQKCKVSPSIKIGAEKKVKLAEIEGPGLINHMWRTSFPNQWRHLIIRVYWDDEQDPFLEVPLGDSYCNGWGERCNVNSLPIAVNLAGGMNSYWEIPFRRRAVITMENLSEQEAMLYYQIDYALMDIPYYIVVQVPKIILAERGILNNQRENTVCIPLLI